MHEFAEEDAVLRCKSGAGNAWISVAMAAVKERYSEEGVSFILFRKL